MTVISMSTTSAGLSAIPQIITAFVPGLDLSALEAISSKVKIATPGQISFAIDTKDGAVQLDLDLKP